MPAPRIERTMGHELEPAARTYERGGAVVRRAGGEELRIRPQQIQGSQEAMPQDQGQAFRIPPQLQNRNEYESFLQSKYGDPWADERNMDTLISNTTSQNEREAFEQVFGGQYRYEDRGQLSKKAQDHWHDSLLMLRKNVENQQKQDIEVRKEQMGEQMKVFDNYVKMFKPAKLEKSRYGAKTVLDMLQDVQDRGTPVTDSEMITFEEMTKDMPIEVKHEITQEAEQRKLFGIDLPSLFDVPEKAELKIKRKTGTKIRKPGESIADWEKRTGTK